MAALHSSSAPPIHLYPATAASYRRRRLCLRSSAVSSAPKARFIARRSDSASVKQLQRPLVRGGECYTLAKGGFAPTSKVVKFRLMKNSNHLINAEYMSLPASQYSVLDAERIERIDDNTFRCYVYRFKFFSFEVCPVLVVRVDEEPNGCCIRLMSCKLEGSPVVEAQNEKFSASMVNRVFCKQSLQDSDFQQLTSDTSIEVAIEIPFPFQALPVGAIESTGRQVLEQILRVMLPRFLTQLVKDYQAWASGDTSRQALGTGEI